MARLKVWHLLVGLILAGAGAEALVDGVSSAKASDTSKRLVADLGPDWIDLEPCMLEK